MALRSTCHFPLKRGLSVFLKWRDHKWAETNGIRYNSLFQHSCDPNSFGNLSADYRLQQKMRECPEEKDDKEEITFIDGIRGKRHLTTKEYADKIKLLIDQKKIPEALNVLQIQMLSEDKVKPDRYIYNLLISICARNGLTKKAFQLYNDLKKRGLKPNSAIYTSLFNACANCSSMNEGLEKAHHLRQLMVEKGCISNQVNYHAMIKAFGRCGDLETSFSIVDEMVENGLKPTTETFNFLLQSCISNTEAGFRHALMVWNKLKEHGLYPDVYTYQLLLRCAQECSIGDQSVFLSEFVRMKTQTKNESNSFFPKVPSRGIESRVDNVCLQTTPSLPIPSILGDSDVHTLVIDGKIALPEHRLMILGGVNGVIKSMACNGVKPDLKTFTYLLQVIPPSLEEEKALLSLMDRYNVKLDIVFCNMLIKKRVLSNRPKEAKDVLNLIKKKSLSADLITFGVLALACRGSQETYGFLEDLTSSGIRCNAEIYGCLVYSAARSWNISLILQLLDKLTEDGIQPNKQLIKHLKTFQYKISKIYQTQDSRSSNHKKWSSPRFKEMFSILNGKIGELETRCQ